MYELSNFDAIKISLASPEQIREWSHGEVTKSETINYRTQKPDKGGLFCERIFGPVKDWECSCGRYRKIKYKGVVCEKCGVEVTKSKVRRERMGHIELATPVAHIWYSKGFGSPIGLLLGLSPKELESVLYYNAFIVLDPGVCAEIQKKDVICVEDCENLWEKYDRDAFRVGMGAEAIKELLMEIDIEKESERLKDVIATKTGQERAKAIKQFEVVEAFRISGNKPEWMILDVLPVFPPDLRPMVQLDGGRFATTDLNDLYRRVIGRNNRLKKLKSQPTPELILRNEKRMVQEIVDALIANGRRGKAITGAGGRELKSLSRYLQGKQGRFRQNLLGKRVDYSGRSVIVIGPELKLYQCGLPKEMALELFKPFVIRRLMQEGACSTIKKAKEIIAEASGQIYGYLEEIIKDHPVLLNRAPTLHRLGIQAFEPVLVEGRAIKLHPLACTAFNADFDGDQMAVHVPISIEAQAEARILMLCTNNILKLSDGKSIVSPGQDIILGSYYLTIVKPGAKGEGKIFASEEEAFHAYQEKEITLQTLCWIRVKGEDENGKPISRMLHTTIGRCIFNKTLPQDLHFVDRTKPENRLMIEVAGLLGPNSCVENKQLQAIWDAAKGKDANVALVKEIRGILHLDVKDDVIKDIIGIVNKTYADGDFELFADENEKRTHALRMSIQKALGFKELAVGKKQLGNIVDSCFKYHEATKTSMVLDDIKALGYKYSTIGAITTSVFDMHIPDAKRRIVEETDALVLKTEKSYQRGLLTEKERYSRIVAIWSQAFKNLEQEMKDNADDFNPIMMMATSGARASMKQIMQLSGMRGLVVDTAGKEIELPVKANYREGLSVLDYFNSSHGGRKSMADTALKTSDSGYLTRRLVDVSHGVIVMEQDCGDTKGIEVSPIMDEDRVMESIKERIEGRYSIKDIINPKTGEIITPADTMITQDQAEEIDKVYMDIWYDNGKKPNEVPKILVRSVLACKTKTGVCSKCYGKNMASGRSVKIGEAVGIIAAQSIGEPGTQLTMRNFHTGGVASGDDITQGLPRVVELFEARRPKGLAVISEKAGRVIINESDNSITVVSDNDSKNYPLSYDAEIKVHDGDMVEAGQPLTRGNIYPQDLFKACGAKGVQDYITKEVQASYRSASVNINDKHIEIIVRQMLRKVKIEDQGGSNLIPGTLVDSYRVDEENPQLIAEGKAPIMSKRVLLGITKAALATESFLSAASFQETTTVLADAAIKNKKDPLIGLKENVIIGKLIPAGTGMKCYKDISTTAAKDADGVQEESIITPINEIEQDDE